MDGETGKNLYDDPDGNQVANGGMVSHLNHKNQHLGGGAQERKSSVASIISAPFRKISDIISPERRISQTINPFYHQLDDEKQFKNEERVDIEEEEAGFDYDAGDFEDDVPDDSPDEEDMREYDYAEADSKGGCCRELRINCSRFRRVMVKNGKELKEEARKIDCKKHCKEFFSYARLKRVMPIFQWLPKYSMEDFQGDLVAGITVGLTVIPQAIAYAALAGITPVFGLYNSFLGSFVYIIFGSAKDITLGPSAVGSLLTSLFATSPIPLDPTISIILAFFVGLIQIGMYLINFGYFMNFISYPVLKGFTVASAVTIAMSQVKRWWGQKGVPRDFMPQLYWTVAKIPEVRIWDFVMGVCCMVIIVVLKKIKEIPWKTKYEDLDLKWKILNKLVWMLGLGRNIVAIILATIVAYIFMENGLRPFSLTGTLPPGVPEWKMPAFSLYDPKTNITHSLADISTNIIGIGFIIVPMLGLIEAIAIGNVFARKSNYRIDINQEFLAYGVGNFLTAFVSGGFITGTFSRTAVNAQCGVRTPMGGIYTGIIVLLALQFLTPVMYYIPDCSLSVVIFMAVLDMITFHKLWIFWRTRKIDMIPWIATLVLSFVISIAYGVIIGAGLSILLLLYPTTKLKIKTMKQSLSSDSDDSSSIIKVTFNSGMLYPAIENVKDILMPLYMVGPQELPKGVILDFQHVATADTTTVQGLRVLLENYHKKGVPLVICNLHKPVESLLRRSKPKFLVITTTIDDAEDLIRGMHSKLSDKNGNVKSTSKKFRKKKKVPTATLR